MKPTLIALLALVVAVGCGKKVQPTDTKQGNNTPKKSAKKKVGKEAQTKTKVTEPVKELTLEEKVVGEYEFKIDENTVRMVFLDNGIVEAYRNGKKGEKDGKWKISKDGELHVTDPDGNILVYRINKGGSLTVIAGILKDGTALSMRLEGAIGREDFPEERQFTFKRIK